MHVCTIVARNYLAAARVLARSFAAHNPGGTCWTLVIDDADHEIDGAAEPFEVVRPEELAIAQWDQMAAGYSVLELSTAVKPWLLRHLLHERGAAGDHLPGPRHPGVRLARRGVRAPHGPRGGRQPASHRRDASRRSTPHGDRHPHLRLVQPRLCRIRPGAEVDQLLDWWSERLATDCLVAPERGYFVDQRWMDLAPGPDPQPRHPARRRLQRRLLEPAQPRRDARRRALHRQRPPAALLSLLRL